MTRSSSFTSGILTLAVLLVAACSGTVGAYTTTGPSTPSPTATTSSASTTIIQLGSVTVKGNVETVFEDSTGKSLYYLDQDKATKQACTGGCLTVWPPLISAAPISNPAGVSGTFTVFMNSANQSQVEFNGHLLYTYSGDTGPGMSTGDGIGGVWHIAASSLSSASSSSSGGYYP